MSRAGARKRCGVSRDLMGVWGAGGPPESLINRGGGPRAERPPLLPLLARVGHMTAPWGTVLVTVVKGSSGFTRGGDREEQRPGQKGWGLWGVREDRTVQAR